MICLAVETEFNGKLTATFDISFGIGIIAQAKSENTRTERFPLKKVSSSKVSSILKHSG